MRNNLHASTPLLSAQLRRASFSLSSTGGGGGEGGQGHPPFVEFKNNIKPIDRFSTDQTKWGKGGEDFIILNKVVPLTTHCSGRGDTLSHAAAPASSATERNWSGGQKWILHRGKNILKINLFVFVFLLLCTPIAGRSTTISTFDAAAAAATTMSNVDNSKGIDREKKIPIDNEIKEGRNLLSTRRRLRRLGGTQFLHLRTSGSNCPIKTSEFSSSDMNKWFQVPTGGCDDAAKTIYGSTLKAFESKSDKEKPAGCFIKNYNKGKRRPIFNTHSNSKSCSGDNPCVCFQPCDVGTFSKILTIGCMQCPRGRATNKIGTHNACDACEAGMYTNQVKQATCKHCLAGKYSDQTSREACKPCSAGRYLETNSGNNAASKCKACKKGQSKSSSAASSCDPCAAGSYADSKGQTSCEICTSGKYLNENGKQTCINCPVGRFNTDSGTVTTKHDQLSDCDGKFECCCCCCW